MLFFLIPSDDYGIKLQALKTKLKSMDKSRRFHHVVTMYGCWTCLSYLEPVTAYVVAINFGVSMEIIQILYILFLFNSNKLSFIQIGSRVSHTTFNITRNPLFW